MTTEDIKSKV